VQVTAIDGKQFAGTLLGLGSDGQLRVATPAGEVARPLEELRKITNQAAHAADLTPTGLLVLRSGLSLRANVRGVPGDRDAPALTVELPPARGEVTIPVRAIAALRVTDLPRADGEGFDDAVRTGSGRDLLFAYRRGDPGQGLVRLTVRVDHFEMRDDEVHVVVEFGGELQPPQPLRKVYGIVLGQGAAPDVQEGPRTTVAVAGGPEFSGRLKALDPANDRCVLRLDEGCDLDLPWQVVATLTVRSDRLVYLSDLEPTEVEQTPALTRKWDWLRDRAPLGPGIELRGTRYERGLVLIPRTRLTFDLGGKFDRFEAMVGIDDRAGDMGDAVVRVRGDGAVLFEAASVRRGNLPYAVSVPVKDVRKLVLEADFGDRLDLGDHCAFAEARVLKDA